MICLTIFILFYVYLDRFFTPFQFLTLTFVFFSITFSRDPFVNNGPDPCWTVNNCVMFCSSLNDFSNYLVSRDRDHCQGGRSGEDSGRNMQRERSFNGAITSISDRSSVDQKSMNGLHGVSRSLCGMSKTMGSQYYMCVFDFCRN